MRRPQIWVNIIGRDPVNNEEYTIWNGFVSAPSVIVDIRPEWFDTEGGDRK